MGDMTDYELFIYTHIIFNESFGDKPIGELDFLFGGEHVIIDLINQKNNIINGCEVVGVTKRRERRVSDEHFKNYFYLQFGVAAMSFSIPISEDYVFNSVEIPIPNR